MATAGQKHLLDFIGGKEAPMGYGTVYGNKQAKLTKPLVTWTVRDIINARPSFTKCFGSSACGRYQFMKATLSGLAAETPNILNMQFTPQLQDALAVRLLEKRGYDKFVDRQISITQFGKALAQEWASFPVLANTQGAHQAVTRGQSYYAGDGMNKALVSAAEVERCLRDVLKIEDSGPGLVLDTPPDPAPGAAPSLASVGIMSMPISDVPDPAGEPVEAAQVDPALIAPAKPFPGFLSLLQGKPPVPKGERHVVVAAAKEEAPSLMKDLGVVRMLGLFGGAGSLLGGLQDTGFLDSVKATADGATSTFESVQTLVNLILNAIKWGVTHWWVFGLVLSLYVLVRIGWAIFKVYVQVKNGLKS